jgi:hypothetical protein
VEQVNAVEAQCKLSLQQSSMATHHQFILLKSSTLVKGNLNGDLDTHARLLAKHEIMGGN